MKLGVKLLRDLTDSSYKSWTTFYLCYNNNAFKGTEGGREGKKVQNLQVNCSVSKQAKQKKDVA